MKNVIKNKKRTPYLKDGMLYSLWKYLNGYRVVNKNTLCFEDLTPVNQSIWITAVMFANMVTELGLDIKGLRFNKEAYLTYYQKKDKVADIKKKNSNLHKSFKAVLNNRYNLEDLKNVCFFNNLGMHEFFEFDKQVFQKTKNKLEYLLNDYIEYFTEDKMLTEKKNYSSFENQKQGLTQIIESYRGEYGNNFLIEFNPDEHSIPFPDFNNSFLFIHSLIAFESLKLIEINKIWIYDWEKPPEDQTEEYKTYITLTPEYLREIGVKNKKSKKRKIEIKKEKTETKYNEGVLHFKNKEINFRNKQNQKELLTTLFEETKKNWSYDEIQDKWDEMIKLRVVDKRKDYWKKFYSAGDDINTTIAIETQIKDFIIKNTKEIRINPRYI